MHTTTCSKSTKDTKTVYEITIGTYMFKIRYKNNRLITRLIELLEIAELLQSHQKIITEPQLISF